MTVDEWDDHPSKGMMIKRGQSMLVDEANRAYDPLPDRNYLASRADAGVPRSNHSNKQLTPRYDQDVVVDSAGVAYSVRVHLAKHLQTIQRVEALEAATAALQGQLGHQQRIIYDLRREQYVTKGAFDAAQHCKADKGVVQIQRAKLDRLCDLLAAAGIVENGLVALAEIPQSKRQQAKHWQPQHLVDEGNVKSAADDEIARITQIASAAEEQAKSAETAAAEAKRTVVEVSKLLVEVDRRATAASSHYSRLVDGQHQGSRRIEANSTRLFRVAADLERLAETLRAATKLSGNAFEELQDRLINGAKNPPDIGLVESVAAPTTKSISPGRGESTRDQLDTRGKGRGGSTSHDVIAVEIADFEGEGHNHGGVLTSEDETKSATTRLLGISEKDTTETDENVQRREVTVGEGYNLVKLADEEMIDDIHFKKQSDSIAATSGHHGMFHRHCGEVMEENRLHAIRDLNCPRRPVCTGLSLVPGEGRAQLSTIPVRPLGSRSLSENATPHAWARMSCPVLPGTEAADESLRLLAEKTAATNRRGTTGYGQDQRSWTRCLLRQGRSMPVLEQYHTAAAEARKWTVERGGRENVYDMPATRVGSAVKFGKNGTGSSARTVTAEESEREEFQTDLADHHHPTAFSSSHVEKGCKLYFPTRPHSRKSDEESLVGEGDLSCGRVEGGGRASTCPRVTVTPSNILVCLGNASAGGSSRQPRTQPSTTPGEPRGPSDIGGGGVESGFEGSTLEAFSVSCERSVAMATKSTGSATDLAGDSFAVEAIFTEGGMGCFGGGTSGRSRGSRVRTKAPHSESNNAGVDGATTKCTTMYRNGTRLAFLESAPKLWCPRDTWTDDGQAVDANHEVSTSPTAPPHRYYQRRRSSIRVELSSHCS